VFQPASDLSFAKKAGIGFFVPIPLRPDLLDRDLSVELPIMSNQHFAQPAFIVSGQNPESSRLVDSGIFLGDVARRIVIRFTERLHQWRCRHELGPQKFIVLSRFVGRNQVANFPQQLRVTIAPLPQIRLSIHCGQIDRVQENVFCVG
jgi:hypothetical protein